MLLVMQDINEGMHPDLDFDKVLATLQKHQDVRQRAIISRYVRKEIENKTSNKDFVSSMLRSILESEDESVLKIVLEALYSLPYRNATIILKELNAEIGNSLSLKTRSKTIVGSSLQRESHLVRHRSQTVPRICSARRESDLRD